MSRAFIRELDGTAETQLPPVQNPERGYMTAAGVERYRSRLQALAQRRDELLATRDDDLPERSELAAIERELAQVVVEDDRGSRSRFQLVGQNEAAPERQRVNWLSPLGRALAGARLGERVEWTTSGGRGAYVVREISYP